MDFIEAPVEVSFFFCFLPGDGVLFLAQRSLFHPSVMDISLVEAGWWTDERGFAEQLNSLLESSEVV